MTRAALHGQILVLFAISSVALLALVGLVIDGRTVYVQRRVAQDAADAAALAGTRTLRASATGAVTPVASDVNRFAAANAFGIPPSVACAYFVGTNAAAVSAGGIVNDGPTAGHRQ
jgi:Flp pilus assembly protein TadG